MTYYVYLKNTAILLSPFIMKLTEDVRKLGKT